MSVPVWLSHARWISPEMHASLSEMPIWVKCFYNVTVDFLVCNLRQILEPKCQFVIHI